MKLDSASNAAGLRVYTASAALRRNSVKVSMDITNGFVTLCTSPNKAHCSTLDHRRCVRTNYDLPIRMVIMLPVFPVTVCE